MEANGERSLGNLAAMVPSAPIMQQLREDTHALHRLAEGQEFQMQLMRGRLPQQLFVAYLEQLFLIHQQLESSLITLAESLPAVGHVVRPDYYHELRLRRDLQFFGSRPDHVQPLPSTTRFLAQLNDCADHEPVTLLGVHYVLEGSKNGGRFQAVKVRDAYALPDETGTEYLDPYGDQQPILWAQYKAAMNEVSLSQAERESIVAGAKETFWAFVDMCQELMGAGHRKDTDGRAWATN